MLQTVLPQVAPILSAFHPLQRQQIQQVLKSQAIPSSAQAAIDMAIA